MLYFCLKINIKLRIGFFHGRTQNFFTTLRQAYEYLVPNEYLPLLYEYRIFTFPLHLALSIRKQMGKYTLRRVHYGVYMQYVKKSDEHYLFRCSTQEIFWVLVFLLSQLIPTAFQSGFVRNFPPCGAGATLVSTAHFIGFMT